MSKATRLSRAKARSEKDDAPQGPPFPDVPDGPPSLLDNRVHQYVNLVRDLRSFATRTDGWLRISPAADDQQVYLKWKFTSGRWPNHYVMVKCEDMRVHFGLQILLRKVYEVDQGERKPTEDKYYDAG